MQKRIFFIFLSIIMAHSSIGQISNDQISQLKDALIKAKHDSTKCDILGRLALGYRFSDIDSSLFYVDQSIDLADKNGLQKYKAQMLSLKGANVLEAGKIPESLQLQFEAMSIAEKLKDTLSIGLIANRIGNIYMELADYKKANEYYFLSKNLFEVIKDSGSVYNELSNIGNVYELMKVPDSAFYYQQLVYEFTKTTNNRNYIIRPEMMFRMGNAYKLKGDNENAFIYYKKGVNEANIDNDLRNLTMNNLFIAELYHELNDADSSMKYAYNAISISKRISFRKGIYGASLLLSKIFNESNKYDSAFIYLTAANVQRDSLTGAKRFQYLQRIVLDEKEKERLAETNRISNKNRQNQFALLAGLGIFLIIAGILYSNNKQKQKANKVLGATLDNLKSTQSQLIQSEKMASLGELTAGIAHEIQNPLNFVNNFSEVSAELLDEMKTALAIGNSEEAIILADDIKQNLEKINHHGKRADAIVKGMLQHSRSSSAVKEATDINALCDEYFRLSYHGLRAKDKSFNATMKTDIDESIKKINIVQQDIGRVILNLINNAFYAVQQKQNQGEQELTTPYEPTVSVSTKKNADNVLISIKDNGDGIPQKIADKIFQPFFTTKPTGQGIGLGLSLAYDIVKAHGGEIKVESKDGEGTTFIVQLPFV